VASKFSRFLEEELEDWGFNRPKAELEKADEDIVDAEVVEGSTGDPLIDQMDAEAAAEDGRLDPTSVPQPA
jgi:hypothetical protein